MSRSPSLFLASTSLALLTSAASAGSLVTSSAVLASAWQSDCRVLGFDHQPGTATFAPGTVVPLASQVADQYVACVQAQFSSAGGPAAAVGVAGSSQQGDAKSLPNILGGTQASGPAAAINYLQPIHVEFVDGSGAPAPARKIGAWNDPTGSLIRLDVFGAQGELLESVEASQGFFLGIERDGIHSATFVYVQGQFTVGFSLDDVTIGRGTTPADLDGSGAVDGADLGTLLGEWGTCSGACCVGDLDGNGIVDGADLGVVLGAWG